MAFEASGIVRGHWHIEAGLHAVLDGTFSEEDGRSRQKKHSQNLVIFRHLVCGILRSHEDKKVRTVSMKRTHALSLRERVPCSGGGGLKSHRGQCRFLSLKSACKK